MFTLKAITEAGEGGFLTGQVWVTSLSEAERWSGVDFTQLMVVKGGSLEADRGAVTGKRGMTGRQAAHAHDREDGLMEAGALI